VNPINLLIKFVDGSSREVTAIVSDLMAFEERFDKSVSDFAKGVRLSWLVFIAWKAETRTKATSLDFDAYADTISAVEVPEVKK
jgi:sugar-specific transcriptional regulator TrmB